MAGRILNFGSLNIDRVYRVEHFVGPGETIASKGYQCFPGGKGLNQSIAAARRSLRFSCGNGGSGRRFSHKAPFRERGGRALCEKNGRDHGPRADSGK